MALGGGTNLCLAKSVPPIASALRETGRHPRGVALPRVCSDLLALLVRKLTPVLRAISGDAETQSHRFAPSLVARHLGANRLMAVGSGPSHVNAERDIEIAFVRVVLAWHRDEQSS